MKPSFARSTFAFVVALLFGTPFAIVAQEKPAETACPPEEPLWAKVPPITPFPRVGLPTFPPTGPGYYSVKDCVTGEYRDKPPQYPYPRFGFIQPSFFDTNWRYLDKPNAEHDTFDCLKRIHLGDDFLFTTGGDIRLRYANEQDRQLTGVDNSYSLLRTRVYGDLSYQDKVRVYVEYLDAHSFGHELTPLPIDVDRSDLLNAFVELKLMEIDDDPVQLRVGRQELLYGSQRLISTLDWANTRRTFQGVKAYHHGKKFDIDLFCVQPVIPSPSHFDSVDNNLIFSGLWTTYRPEPNQFIDLYYLNLDNTNAAPTRQGIRSGPQNVHTLGSRYFGETCNGFLWDFEGMMQLGSRRGEPICAQAGTAGLGYRAKEHRMAPQFWLYYDYASGDDSPAALNTARTFNQLFPFGHYYFGAIDVVGRQNIHDLNGQFTIYPTKWLTFIAQAHMFRLANDRDALYNAAGLAIRRDPTGRAGNDVGQEIDLAVNVHLSNHADIYFDYSYLFAGDFIKQTGNGRSPEYVFVQFSYRW